MNNKERVIKALNHEQPDITPFHVEFTQQAEKNMIQYYGDAEFTKKLNTCFKIVEFVAEDEYREVRPNIFEDRFGVQWDRNVDKDIGTVCNRLITPENIDDYEFPDSDNPELYKGKMQQIDENSDKFIMGYLGFSLFERAWTLAGMENILMAMVIDKPFVHRLMDRIFDYNMKVIQNGLKLNIDGFQFGDDWGQQSGLIMGPQLWAEFIKPRIKEMYGLVKSRNKYVTIHCCGKVDDLFPELIECGLDMFNPFQPEVINVKEAKQKYEKKLSFYGGISTQKTLPYGTTTDVREEVKRLLDVVGNNGGYVAAPAHAVPADAKPENIAAMLDVLSNQK